MSGMMLVKPECECQFSTARNPQSIRVSIVSEFLATNASYASRLEGWFLSSNM